MAKRLRSVDTKWFFTDIPFVLKLCTTIFVRGDAIVLAPLAAALALTYFVSIKFGLIMTGSFIAIRYFGEMIYWLFHQFYDRKYRPSDMGFKNLDNNAIYLLYQTISLAWVMVGMAIAVFAVLYIQ